MNDIRTAIADAVRTESLHLVVLSRPRDGDSSTTTKVSIRPVLVGEQLHYQLARRVGAQEFHENVLPTDVEAVVTKLGSDSFDQMNLYTSEADLEFRRLKDGSEVSRRSAPTHRAVDKQHNKTRHYLIPDGEPCPFLIATGIMSASGRVRASRQRKFRQINRYLEIVNDIVRYLPHDRELRIIDFGCGRSYLTFALHHLFVNVHQRAVRITGLDLKPKVIEQCRLLARELDCRGLEFLVGDIAQFESSESIDLCVSLHACDTATDAALARAVNWDASVILAVPCCHKEIAPQIENAAASPLLRHGILRDRFAALATDSLRARALDAMGYRSQVIEFIDTEHTPKNLMIRAIRREAPDVGEALAEYRQFRDALGIRSFYLESATGLDDRL